MAQAVKLIQEIIPMVKLAQALLQVGGGASIRDLGRVDSSSQSNITNNQTKGGNGANGKIILEWWR